MKLKEQCKNAHEGCDVGGMASTSRNAPDGGLAARAAPLPSDTFPPPPLAE